jgi:hypothetical protein
VIMTTASRRRGFIETPSPRPRALSPTRRGDGVRNGSKSKKRPPATSSDGDDARRWRTCQIEAPFHAESPTWLKHRLHSRGQVRDGRAAAEGHLALGRHLAAGHACGAGAAALERARAGGAAERLCAKWGPGAAAACKRRHALRVMHKAFPQHPGEPGHSLQAVKNRAA